MSGGGTEARRLPDIPQGRLVFGDWGVPLLRDPIDLLRAAYVVGFAVELATGDIGGASRMGVTVLFVYLARGLDVPRPFDLAFVLAMGLQGWGNTLNAFESIGIYDKVVHVTLTGATAALLYIALARLRLVLELSDPHDSHKLVGAALTTFALGLSIGALYEIYEWLVNNVLGGDLSISEADTISDLGADAIGGLAAGALVALWAQRGWGTVRRVPADA